MVTAPTSPGGAVYDLFIGLVPALYFLWQFVQAEGVVWPFWFYAIGVPFAWKPWLVYRRKCPAPLTGHKDVRDRNSRMECCYNACAFLFYVAWLRQTGLTTATILAFLGCVFTTLSSPFFNRSTTTKRRIAGASTPTARSCAPRWRFGASWQNPNRWSPRAAP